MINRRNHQVTPQAGAALLAAFLSLSAGMAVATSAPAHATTPAPGVSVGVVTGRVFNTPPPPPHPPGQHDPGSPQGGPMPFRHWPPSAGSPNYYAPHTF